MVHTKAARYASFGTGLFLLALCGGLVMSCRSESPAEPSGKTKDASAVTCLGRIWPEDGLIRVSARSLSGQATLVQELRVAEGAIVKTGDLLAVLNSHDQLRAAHLAANAAVTLAERRLAQVKAGAKGADLAAQQADIARIELELANADLDLERWQRLSKAELVSASDYDVKRLVRDTRQQQLRQSRERLRGLTEVRDVDVEVARAELETARTRARLAAAEWEQSQVRAPADGHVVEIHTWPGEEIGPAGILELARTGTMYVLAEVPEGDVQRVRPGQAVTVTGDALAEPLHGRVERVGTRVSRNDVRDANPLALSDARVIETHIRLDRPDLARGLIDAEVTVRIQP
jgi:HlyD family secretion protein